MKKTNPFLFYFLSFAILCCLIFSIFFISYYNEKTKMLQEQYCQKKVNAMASDFETHLETMERISLQLGMDQRYQKSNINSKYDELEILKYFHEKYSNYSILTDDLFLYYFDDNKIFHLNGKTISLESYFSTLNKEDHSAILQAISEPENTLYYQITENEIFFFLPIRFSITENISILFGSKVTFQDLQKRLALINGNAEENWFIYEDELLLCSNTGSALPKQHGSIFSATSFGERFHIYYLPDTNQTLSIQNIFLHITLFILDIGMILVLIYLYSNKVNEPFHALQNKYHNDTKSAFERQKRHYLKMVLNGSSTVNIQKEAENFRSLLSGPFYYVISIACDGMEESTLNMIQEKLEQPFSANNTVHIYAICEFDQKQIWVIVSFTHADEKPIINEHIQKIAEEFLYECAKMGVGKTYNQISRISASFLESQDNLVMICQQSQNNKETFSYTPETFQTILDMLPEGNQEAAIKNLLIFVSKIKNNNISFLMQQYLFVNFLVELKKLAQQYNIELSKQNISLLIAAKNINQFYEASVELICEFCDTINHNIDLSRLKQTEEICKYIEAHFMEYQLSIETVAEQLNIPVPEIRKAVFDKKGMLYRDYIIELKMNCARTLLKESELSVAEISEQIGYSSVSYFIKIFKKTFNITPAKYMKQNRGYLNDIHDE